MSFRDFWEVLSPPVDASDFVLHKWRTLIALLSVFATGGVILLFILVFGMSPFFSGFAMKSDVEKIQIMLLESTLWELSKDECHAAMNNNQDALDFIQRELQRNRLLYFQTVGREYVLPTCRQVGAL